MSREVEALHLLVGDVEEVLDVEDADDVVGGVAIDGEPAVSPDAPDRLDLLEGGAGGKVSRIAVSGSPEGRQGREGV